MALKKDYTTEGGLLATDAYIEVIKFRGNPAPIQFEVGVWANEQAHTDGLPMIATHKYVLPIDQNDELYKTFQLYLYTFLKNNTVEFAGALDIV